MSDKVLIIEDNQELRENTAELLQLAGYEVQVAANGLEGLMQLRKSQADLILCDIMMPELDGFGVLRAIRNIPELVGIPLVFMTSKAERSDFRKGMDLGADDYLIKPFSGEELLRVVNARLERSRLLQQKIIAVNDDLDVLMKSAQDILNSSLFSSHRETKRFRKRDNIYMEGDTGTYLYYVISGKVKTYRANSEGKEYMTGLYLGGDFFGHFAIIHDTSRRESAVALEDSEMALFPKQEFQRWLASDKSFSLQFIVSVMKSLDEAEQRMLKLAYDSTRSRVAEALLFLFRKYRAKDGDTIPLSRENLSALAGISPESASRNLSDFRDEGVIETYHGSVKLCSIYKLEHLRY